MPTGSITLTSRPLRLAFLIDYQDRAALLEAIRINSYLWGGIFNPIIPLFKNTVPKAWREKAHWNGKWRTVNSSIILQGYLDAFDPDLVVPVGMPIDHNLPVGHRALVHPSDVLQGIEETGSTAYGISLPLILQKLYNEEFKFVRQSPLSVQ